MVQLPTSRHFTLHEIGKGIYAAIHADGGWAQSNAGIIDIGDRTLIYDTFISPLATQDLLAAAQTLTGRPVHAVLNSHYHNDHTWGNLAVPLHTDIISTEKTRDIIAARETKLDLSYREYVMKSLGEMQTQLEHATSEREKAHAQYFVVYYEAIIHTISMLPSRVPNLIFENTLEFIGNKHRARFIARSGHTFSDAILHLPDEHILFLGDLLFVDAHPYFDDGNLDEFRETLAFIKGLNADILIPGHGSLGSVKDVDAMLEYSYEMQELVERSIKNGTSRDDILKSPIPAKYVPWIFSNFYEENIQFMYGLCSKM
jgi:cyclase